MQKIKKNDTVIVLTGKDKGKTGKVLEISTKDKKAKVSGVSIITKAVKPNPNANENGGLVKKEAFIHLSNLAFYNEEAKTKASIGFKIVDNKKVRYCKKTDKVFA